MRGRTLVTTTEQRVRGQESWQVEGGLWRVLWRGFVGSWWTSHYERDDQRPRLDPARRGPETGSGGGWPAPLRWRTIAVDALVSAIRSNGTATRRADRIDGVALWARRRKGHVDGSQLQSTPGRVGRWRLRWGSILACAVARTVA